MSMNQFDLFARPRLKVHIPQNPDPDAIRLRLAGVLDQLRSAGRMPWEPWQLRSWCHVFYNMANWLPPEERDKLRQDFSTEVERLMKS